ncbi:MAG: hypothetical protein H7240_08370 [Glaciimonas sp.]|nr:hypothetical protein [Glaciimonas sp.]
MMTRRGIAGLLSLDVKDFEGIFTNHLTFEDCSKGMVVHAVFDKNYLSQNALRLAEATRNLLNDIHHNGLDSLLKKSYFSLVMPVMEKAVMSCEFITKNGLQAFTTTIWRQQPEGITLAGVGASVLYIGRAPDHHKADGS